MAAFLVFQPFIAQNAALVVNRANIGGNSGPKRNHGP
jgi:hypothetical protein